MMKIAAKAAARYMAWIMGKNDRKRIKHQKLPQGVAVRKDIAYLPDKNKGHLLDIYYPKYTHEKLPLIINIHGGGLVYGYKEINREFNMHMAAQGYTVISLNYRLIPKVTVMEQIQDILDAFLWIEGHDDQYPYDLKQVYVTGDSAGAYLALYAGAVSGSAKMQKIFKMKGVEFKIRAYGFISGMFYISKKDQIGKMQSLLFHNREKKEKYYPYLKNPSGLLKNYKMPPCYLVTSDEDMIQDYSKEFVKLLGKYEYPYQFHNWKAIEGKKLEHVFCVTHPSQEEGRVTIQEMLSFFEQSKSMYFSDLANKE